VNRGNDTAPDWRCGLCSENCDCQIGDYCVKSSGPDAGNCVSLAKSGKLGTACVIFGGPDQPNSKLPRLGIDDRLVCGLAVYNLTTSEFVAYEWLGDCARGICRECRETETITDSVSQAGRLLVIGLSRTGLTYPNTGSQSWADRGGLTCEDRTCKGGLLKPAPSDFQIYYFTGTITALLGFTMIIFGILFVTCFLEFCARMHDPKFAKFMKPMVARYLINARSRSQSQSSLSDVDIGT
jgi:hypothetical protein